MLESEYEKVKESIINCIGELTLVEQKRILKWMHDEYRNYMIVSVDSFRATLDLIESKYSDSPLMHVIELIRNTLSEYAGANCLFFGTNRVIISNNWQYDDLQL